MNMCSASVCVDLKLSEVMRTVDNFFILLYHVIILAETADQFQPWPQKPQRYIISFPTPSAFG